MNWDHVQRSCEFLANIAFILGVPFALFEFYNHARETNANARKDRIEAAERIHREVDQRYMDFVRTCIDHPRLDCYSTPRQPELKLNPDEQQQQRMLYSALTDLFEVAYLQYNKGDTKDTIPEVHDLYAAQWR